MKRLLCVLMLLSMLLVTGCGNGNNSNNASTEDGYSQITMQEAMSVFDDPGDYIVLDVRTKEEYESGHIPNAINVANEDIGTEKPAKLPDLNQTIYVYCRSGNRSKQAATKLVEIGYTNIIECGGIKDWTGELQVEDTK